MATKEFHNQLVPFFYSSNLKVMRNFEEKKFVANLILVWPNTPFLLSQTTLTINRD